MPSIDIMEWPIIPRASLSISLSFSTFVCVLPLPILRMLPSILQGGNVQLFIHLMRFLLPNLVSIGFLALLRSILIFSFISVLCSSLLIMIIITLRKFFTPVLLGIFSFFFFLFFFFFCRSLSESKSPLLPSALLSDLNSLDWLDSSSDL